MTRAINCPSCGTSVVGGRLSCPSCGAILAPVRGAPRGFAAGPTAGSGTGSDDVPEAVTCDEATSASTADGEGTGAEAPSEAPAGGSPPPPILRDWTGPEPSTAPLEPPGLGLGPAADAAPAELPAGPPTWHGVGSVPERPVPGAYLPPSAVFVSSASSAARARVEASGAETASREPPRRVPADAERATGDRSSGLALRALGEPAAGWLVVVGSVLAVVAFLLPWSPNGVIGSPGDPGYLGRWGLANGAYLLVMAASFGCLAVQVLETRLPVVVRDGILPLVLGGFLLGFGWTYVAGPFGADLGVQGILLGGALLVLGGVLGLRPASRSGGPPAS